MKQICDSEINRFVREYVPSSLLQTDGFVISGGFTTALYHYYLNKNNGSFNTLVNKVGDIDYWVLKNSQAESLLEPWLRKSESEKLQFIEQNDPEVKKALDKLDVELRYITRLSLSFARKIHNQKDIYKPLRLQQIIRIDTYKSITDIIKNFDLNICKTAWYKDRLYVSGDVEADFYFKELTLGQDLKTEANFFQRCVTASRLLKYYDRYQFEPNKEATSALHSVLLEAVDYINAPTTEQMEHYKRESKKSSWAFPIVQPKKKQDSPEPLLPEEIDWNKGIYTIDKFRPKIPDPYDKKDTGLFWNRYNECRQLVTQGIPAFLKLQNCNVTLASMFLDVDDYYAKKELEEYLSLGGKSSVTNDSKKFEVDDFIQSLV